MKAIRVHSHGGPEVLRIEEIDPPKLKPGESLVRVQYAGVNFLDIYQRTGLYKISLPFTPGMEGAGILEGGELAPGTRVAWTDFPGAYAEFAAVPTWKLVPVPDEIELSTAAAALLQGLTAEYLTESTYPVKAGDTALVHAGAGGVGLLLIQMIKRNGARVFTTVSTEEKAQLARSAGADLAIRYTEEDFVSAVRAATQNQGVNVVYDSVGAQTFAGSLESLKPRGMLVLFGQSSGRVPPFDIAMLQPKSLFLTRPSLALYIANREELLERARKLFGWLAGKELQVRIHHVYPLSEAGTAQADLESRKTSGKLLLKIGA